MTIWKWCAITGDRVECNQDCKLCKKGVTMKTKLLNLFQYLLALVVGLAMAACGAVPMAWKVADNTYVILSQIPSGAEFRVIVLNQDLTGLEAIQQKAASAKSVDDLMTTLKAVPVALSAAQEAIAQSASNMTSFSFAIMPADSGNILKRIQDQRTQ